MTHTDSNKHIVQEFIAALFTRGDLSAVDRYLDPGFVNHDPPMPDMPVGPDGMRQASQMFRSAFPDWRSEVVQLIAEGRPGGGELRGPRHTSRSSHGRDPDRTRGRAPRHQHIPHRRRENR
jgi:hypothetical protein